MWEKNKGTNECDKITIICNIGITQCDNETVKCKERKIRLPLNVKKVHSNIILVLLNVTMKLSNVRKK